MSRLPLTLEQVQQGLVVKVVQEPFHHDQYRVQATCCGVPVPSPALIEVVLQKHLPAALFKATKRFPPKKG